MQIPSLYARKTVTRPEMLGSTNGYHDGSNSFNRHTFVVLTAGILAAVASAGTSACGFCLDASKASSGDVVNPPYDMFGDRHFPIALGGQRFAISVTDSAGHIGQANSAPQMSSVNIGVSYGILKQASGDHALNISDTTNLFFTVVEKPTSWGGVAQDANTYNPVVIVEIVPAAIQVVG